MQHYNLVNNSCQDFCNKFLEKYKFSTFPTTAHEVVCGILEGVLGVQNAPESEIREATREVTKMVGQAISTFFRKQ